MIPRLRLGPSSTCITGQRLFVQESCTRRSALQCRQHRYAAMIYLMPPALAADEQPSTERRRTIRSYSKGHLMVRLLEQLLSYSPLILNSPCARRVYWGISRRYIAYRTAHDSAQGRHLVGRSRIPSLSARYRGECWAKERKESGHCTRCDSLLRQVQVPKQGCCPVSSPHPLGPGIRLTHGSYSA